MNDATDKEDNAAANNPPRDLPAPAQRALAEAETRRKSYRASEAAMPKELGGRGGNEPVRYGDWEVKGLTSDF